jgi:ERO1-like protein alpha
MARGWALSCAVLAALLVVLITAGQGSSSHVEYDGVGVSTWTDKVPVEDVKHGVEPDYCCCSTEEVNSQAPAVLHLLNSIVNRPFFRFIRVNVHKECPYYAVSLLCTSEHAPCTVCKCNADDIPVAFRVGSDITKLPDDYTDEPLSSKWVPQSVNEWGADFFGGLTDEHGHGADDQAEYVDLAENPEGHTGYSGPLAHRIWEGVYNDNCVFDGFDECSELDVFHTLVSGLHSSISTHIALTWNQFIPGTPRETNCDELRRRVLDHPNRVRSVHVLYQFVLRAVTRAADSYLRSKATYESGRPYQDDELWRDLQQLFREKLLCSHTFNETVILGKPNSRALVAQMRRQMKNMTTLTDCIACEKCRVWGKLQFLGLATALKIVTQPTDAKIDLARNEMVALINLLRQLAATIDTLGSAQCGGPAEAPALLHIAANEAAGVLDATSSPLVVDRSDTSSSRTQVADAEEVETGNGRAVRKGRPAEGSDKRHDEL